MKTNLFLVLLANTVFGQAQKDSISVITNRQELVFKDCKDIHELQLTLLNNTNKDISLKDFSYSVRDMKDNVIQIREIGSISADNNKLKEIVLKKRSKIIYKININFPWVYKHQLYVFKVEKNKKYILSFNNFNLKINATILYDTKKCYEDAGVKIFIQ